MSSFRKTRVERIVEFLVGKASELKVDSNNMVTA